MSDANPLTSDGTNPGWESVGTPELLSDQKELLGELFELLSDQAIYLYFINKSAKNDPFLVLGITFQGQKH